MSLLWKTAVADEHPLAPGIKHPTRLGEPPRFYHGTVEEFEPDDHILPSAQHGNATFRHESDPEHAYATTKEDDAWWYAEHAWGARSHGTPRVYQVEPLGHTEEDPQWDGERHRGNLEHDVRSQHGFRVLHEVEPPEYMGDPEDWR
jgi:hypothetical protein